MDSGKKKLIIGLSILTVAILGGVAFLSIKAKAKNSVNLPTLTPNKDNTNPPITANSNNSYNSTTKTTAVTCGSVMCTPEQIAEAKILANAPIECRKKIKFNYGQ